MSDDYFGVDIAIDDSAEMVLNGTDFKLSNGVENVLQRIKFRMMTPKGALFYDSSFGCDLWKFIKLPFTKGNLDYFVSIIKSCLKAEPLVDNDSIKIELNKESTFGFYCSVKFNIFNYDNDLNLVVSADKTLKILGVVA
jgi:hypothetical protein